MDKVGSTVELTYPIRHEDGLPQDLPEGVNIPEFNRYFAQKANDHAVNTLTLLGWSKLSGCQIKIEFSTTRGAKDFINDLERDLACPPCHIQYTEAAIEDTIPKRKDTLIWIALDSGTWGDADELVIATLRPQDDIDQWSDSSIIDFGEMYGTRIRPAATNE